MDDGCLFCRILAGDVEAEVVLDEPELMGFLDHRPVFKGHVLLVPRRHLVTLPELPAGLRDGFLEATQRLCEAVVAGLGAQGLVNCTFCGAPVPQNLGVGMVAA